MYRLILISDRIAESKGEAGQAPRRFLHDPCATRAA